MIKIGKPSVVPNGDKVRLAANITIDGEISQLWFEVDASYGRFLCPERSDAFVLAFIQYAIQYGHDITTETPMTDRLYDRLTEGFLPAFNKANELSLKIVSDVAPEVEHPSDGCHVGTGCSCGVDSLHVYARHADITDACVWNGHGADLSVGREARAGVFAALVNRARNFSAEAKVQNVLVGDSNFDEGCVKGLRWDGMTTYGNLFMVFALQKYWRKYYIASDCDVANFSFKIKGVFADPARYEYFLFPFLALKGLLIEMDGSDRNRVEKVADLASYEPARKYLNVCHRINEGHRNGSYDCPKCMRTMLDLDCCGMLDGFSEVFDVAYYRRNFHEYLAEYYRGLIQGDNFALELVPYMKNRDIALGVRLKAIRILAKKALMKLLRGGSTKMGGFSSK